MTRQAWLRRRWVVLLVSTLVLVAGCTSPEDGRPRGGGAGGDGGNYRQMPVHVPSKIDATKVVPANEP